MAARRGRRHPRRGRPDRGQRRHGQQGRDVHRWPSWRPATASRSTSAPRPARSTSRPPTARRSPIEERRADEVLEFRGVRIAPPGTEVRNPAFDVTPAELITGIVTEEGVIGAAVRGRPARRGRGGRGALGGDARLPRRAPRAGHGIAASRRPADRRRAGRSRLMATVAVGRRGAIVARATTDKARAPRLPRARPAVRGVRDLRPRGARVRADPLGRWPGTATRRSRSSSSTTARRRSRCS